MQGDSEDTDSGELALHGINFEFISMKDTECESEFQ